MTAFKFRKSIHIPRSLECGFSTKSMLAGDCALHLRIQPFCKSSVVFLFASAFSLPEILFIRITRGSLPPGISIFMSTVSLCGGS